MLRRGQGGGPVLRAPANAPAWMQTFARDMEAWGDTAKRGPQALTVYSITELPDAAATPFALIALRDGAGNKHAAISNGVAWFYLDGAAV